MLLPHCVFTWKPLMKYPFCSCPGVPVSRLLLQLQQNQLEARSKAALQAATISLIKHFGCMMLQYGLFQVSHIICMLDVAMCLQEVFMTRILSACDAYGVLWKTTDAENSSVHARIPHNLSNDI